MTEKERMLAGKLYKAGDPELLAGDMRKLLGTIGADFWIQPPFYCDYGSNIHIGDHFYANYGCVILDPGEVFIGDHVFLAPRVSIYTATHPIDAEVRNAELEYALPVRIGSSVWIGGNTVICPGVTIGDNVVIGAGSVVTKDIPSGVVAAGNPCKVLRPITDADRDYWQAQAGEYYAEHSPD